MLLQLIINGLVIGSLYALVTLGFTLVLSVTKIWHFAHAGVFTLGAYMVWYGNVELGLSILISFLMAIIVVTIVVVLIEWLIYGTLRKKSAPPLIFFVSSLILTTFIENTLALFFTSDAKGYSTQMVEKGMSIGNAVITRLDLLSVFVSVSLISIFLILYKYSKWGVMMKATSDNEDMAEIIGINVKFTYYLVFVVGAILAVPAAYLVSLQQGIQPTIGFEILLVAVTATIIGGMGSIPGAIIGAYIVGLLESLGVWKLSSEWEATIVFGLLFLVIISKPTGLLGKPIKAVKV